MVHFHVISLFPDAIRPYLESSMLGKAQEKKKIKISYYNPKDFVKAARGSLRQGSGLRTQDERVDRRPYGGGPGMVLRPEPMLRAIDKAKGKKRGAEVLFFATDGEQFTEEMAKKIASRKKYGSQTAVFHVVLVCGHYEGVDARVAEISKAKKVSVGPYVLTGGELPAATVIDAVARFVPGVLGKAESLEASRVSSPDVYTRPEVLEWKKKKYKVPPVLLTGNHAEIEKWKKERRGVARKHG
jgi:tRNA (guanine37-N1)-methyltransferase